MVSNSIKGWITRTHREGDLLERVEAGDEMDAPPYARVNKIGWYAYSAEFESCLDFALASSVVDVPILYIMPDETDHWPRVYRPDFIVVDDGRIFTADVCPLDPEPPR